MSKELKNYITWMISILAFVGFSIILIMYYNKSIGVLDVNSYVLISNIRSDFLTNIMKVISYLGEYKLLILVTILLFLFTKKKEFSMYLGLVSISSFAVNFAIKHVVQRPRPTWGLIPEDGYSFVSNHSIAMMTFYGFILYCIWKSKLDKTYKIIISIITILLMIIVPFSRIYLGVHYTSDVLAGLLFGLSYLIAFIKIVYKK